jgi:hypothetical protein
LSNKGWVENAMRTLRTLLVIVVGVVALGCSKAPDVGSAKSGLDDNTPPGAPNTSSPDNVVKSWWGYVDYRNSLASKNCLEHMRLQEEKHKPVIYEVAAGELAEYRFGLDFLCAPEKFERNIDRVQVESETRAVVHARVKNVTPIPTGVLGSTEEHRRRQVGDGYKYVTEKFDKGWRVSQVFVEVGGPDGGGSWVKLYATKTGPRFPSGAGEQ